MVNGEDRGDIGEDISLFTLTLSYLLPVTQAKTSLSCPVLIKTTSIFAKINSMYCNYHGYSQFKNKCY